MAWWYRTYSTDTTLKELEQSARVSRRGLWADADPVPPWEFREKNQPRESRVVRPHSLE
jgi:endonuclease YncB( thermonuclease family)